MMMFSSVRPEVAGGLGDNTVLDSSVHPPIVDHLHYVFDGWLGDVIVASFPVFLITDEGRTAIRSAGMSGVSFGPAEVTTSAEFADLYPDCSLPSFVRLHAAGRAGHDDFGLAGNIRLVVSDRALKLLSGLGLAHARIAPFTAE